jgi:methyltransferase (TIGR00027 family)
MNAAEGSRTAVLVCQGRAVAQGRLAPGRLNDPVAVTLLRGEELASVEVARSGVAPKGWADRLEYERLLATAVVMAARTVAIDDAIRARVTPQLLILGAGLDGRAWRMTELAGVDVFEIDHPASQRDKLDRLGTQTSPARAVHFVPVDFGRDSLEALLESAGHRAGEATTWIWEGVVPYLSRAEVEATLRVVTARSAPGSRLIVNYQAPALRATLGRLAARAMAMLSRRSDPLAGEPWRSAWTPTDMAQLMAANGFRVGRDTDLLTVTGSLRIPVRNSGSLRSGRVLTADR